LKKMRRMAPKWTSAGLVGAGLFAFLVLTRRSAILSSSSRLQSDIADVSIPKTVVAGIPRIPRAASDLVSQSTRKYDRIMRLSGGSTVGQQDPNQVASAFVNYYYRTFDTNRGTLASLYTQDSVLTFEGEFFRGAQAIQEKLVSLQFQTVVHKIHTMDAQMASPTGQNQGIIVFVCGDLFVDGGKNPIKFSQVFQLFPHPQGNWYVQNDIFRLNYG